MAECAEPSALIERILVNAKVPAYRRDAVRRELLDHFEDATAAHSLSRAVTGFGDEAGFTAELRAVYRRETILLYLVKVAVLSACALVTVALALALGSVRLDTAADAFALRIAPGYGMSFQVAAALILGVVALHESGGQRFAPRRAAVAALAWTAVCAGLLQFGPQGEATMLWAAVLLAGGLASFRSSMRLPRVALAVAVFAAMISALHSLSDATLSVVPVLLRSVALVSAWCVTNAIAARLDQVFQDPFETTQELT